MTRSRICVLASGGLDSSVLLEFYARRRSRVFPLYVRHGFLWEKAEIRHLKNVLKILKSRRVRPLTILYFPLGSFLGNHWSLTGENTPRANSKDTAAYLPARNLLLLWLAAIFCSKKRIDRIALGTLRTNPFPDSTPAFFRCMEKILRNFSGRNLRIERPFSRLSKTGALRLARKIPPEMTFSCLRPRGSTACGQCNKCAEWKKALIARPRMGMERA